jgi:fibronectin type 3 domain-containing protein
MNTRTAGWTHAPGRNIEMRLRAFRCGAMGVAVACLGWWMGGCGSPGEPVPPSPPIPVAVTDLMVRQSGDGALLTFTLPGKSTLGEKLVEVPTIEILRGSLRADGTPDPKSFRVVDSVPGSLVSNYTQMGQVQFWDALPPGGARTNPGDTVVYRVRMRVTQKKTSASSNEISIILRAVPEAVESLESHVTERGVVLKWQTPGKMSGGGQLTGELEYHVYRGELDAAHAEAVGGKDAREIKWKMPLAHVGTVASPGYLDSGITFAKTYGYVVRSVIAGSGIAVESNDSKVVIVTPKDTFPPGAPQGLVAAVLPGAVGRSQVVDLSWAINAEPDLAGYLVYRSEQSGEQPGEQKGERGTLLTAKPLPTPAYRDETVLSGHHYWYRVTAVDEAGNESEAGTAADANIVQPSP